VAAGVERIVYTCSVATLGILADGSPADEQTPVSLGDMIGHYKRCERYILGGQDMSLGSILRQVAELTGRRPPSIKLPHQLVMPIALVSELVCRLTGSGEPLATLDAVRMARKHMYFSSDKAHRELGYTPRPAQQALADTVEWFRQQGRLDKFQGQINTVRNCRGEGFKITSIPELTIPSFSFSRRGSSAPRVKCHQCSHEHLVALVCNSNYTSCVLTVMFVLMSYK